MLINSDLDPHMYSALAPGAWWEVANGSPLPPIQPYADEAGEAAVEAARRGPLEVRDREHHTVYEICICTIMFMFIVYQHSAVRADRASSRWKNFHPPCP